jgi:hypothetical protein
MSNLAGLNVKKEEKGKKKEREVGERQLPGRRRRETLGPAGVGQSKRMCRTKSRARFGETGTGRQ